jgi:vacuolar-type H+-ATPase subunit H
MVPRAIIQPTFLKNHAMTNRLILLETARIPPNIFYIDHLLDFIENSSNSTQCFLYRSSPKVPIMESTLKRLLAVETEAEQLVTKSQTEREQIIHQALHDAHQAEVEFKAKIPALKAHWLTKAEARAHQTLTELTRRYDEKQQHLRDLAQENQQRALEAALQLIKQVGK